MADNKNTTSRDFFIHRFFDRGKRISYDRVCILKWAHRKEVFPLRLGLLLGPVPTKEGDVSIYVKAVICLEEAHYAEKLKKKLREKKKIVTP